MARKPPPPGKGGARPGSGRKPSEFLAKCREMSSSPRFLKWAQDVLDGELVEMKATITGVVHVTASTGDRTYLWEKLAAYGFGKPSQPIEMSGDIQGRIVLVRSPQ